jgi:hypothetical protein
VDSLLRIETEVDTHLAQEVVVQQEVEQDNPGLGINVEPIVPPDPDPKTASFALQ